MDKIYVVYYGENMESWPVSFHKTEEGAQIALEIERKNKRKEHKVHADFSGISVSEYEKFIYSEWYILEEELKD